MSEPTQHPWPPGTRRLQVHDIRVDLRYRRVIRGDQESELPQRMFDLLLVFLAEPHVLHNRADLFARVWPGVIVEDANLSQSVWMLRKALGDARKHWIRTVAKSGYVFEPPGPVEAISEAAPVAAAVADPAAAYAAAPAGSAQVEVPSAPAEAPRSDDPADPPPVAPEIPAPSPADTPPPSFRLRARAAWTALALLALTAVGSVAWWLHDRDPAGPPPPAAELAIALIDIEDKAAPADARWPVVLLHAWLGWKLESLPEVTLLTEAHLAADSQGRSPRIVFLSSGADSADPSQVFLRARFQQAGHEQQLERKGPLAQLPEMADALSQELVARLVPSRAGEAWPPLALDSALARRYSEGIEALENRDWVASSRLLGEVVERAPDFGLARLQLGRVLARLANAAPALAQTDAALERLHPLPRDVAAVLEAERLSRDPMRAEEAAAAFARLAQAHPGKISYALDQARMLRRAGQYKEALAILGHPQWNGQTVGNRLSQRLNLAAIYLSMGDAVRAREHAQAAERIASAAGKGWEQERGDALLLLAQVDRFQNQTNADPSGYERAAEQFDLAGDDMSALLARFLAESTKTGSASGMDHLLVQARERGYRRLEIDILRVVAFRHYNEGDMPAYRALLEQALATSLTAGDVREQHLLELDLLNEDFLRGRFDDADRRLVRLRKAGLQGDEAMAVGLYDALIAANRGQFATAEAALDEAEKRDREANPGTASTSRARISCLRADLRLVQGDISQARAGWKGCEASGQPSAAQQSRVGNAYIDLLAGDRAAALRQLIEAVKPMEEMQDGPDRWLDETTMATLLTRAGDPVAAERMYMRVLPQATQSEYDWIIATAHVGLAETAATRRDWAAARAHIAAARQQHVSDVWALSNRIDVMDAATAIAEGDRKRAMELLSAVHAKARRNNDAVTQLEVQSLLPPGVAIGECGEGCKAALIARTGLRGSNLDWLTGPSGLDTSVLKPAAIQ